jgi:glycosyltransferase involved in cell wall biosynthesis
MRLCHVVPSLEKRHGGPSVSVPSLARALAQAGHTVEVLTTAPEAARTTTEGQLTTRTFARQWPRGFCASAGLRDAVRESRAEVIHAHSLWLRPLHYAHQAARLNHAKLVISPRGMMSRWAWNHHRTRKQFAGAFLHPGALAAADGWHATSSEEADDIRRLGFRQPVCVAPNGITPPAAEGLIAAGALWHERCPATVNRPVALFYSRFHRKKRLRELVHLWLAAPRSDWLLLLVGLPEEYSVAEVQSWITTAKASDRVAVFDGTDLPPPYAVATLFLLPSHSENFGLAIAEALAAGVPALVTDGTPWAGLNTDDRGWCVPWADFHRALEVAINGGPARLAERGARARAWVLREFSWQKSAGTLATFYQQLSASPP